MCFYSFVNDYDDNEGKADITEKMNEKSSTTRTFVYLHFDTACQPADCPLSTSKEPPTSFVKSILTYFTFFFHF